MSTPAAHPTRTTSTLRPRSAWWRRLKMAALAVPLLSAVWLAPADAAAESKVAVIDLRRAVLETEEGLRVQATLKKLFDNRQVELSEKERKLMADKKQVETDAKTGKLKGPALQAKEQELNQAWNDLQRTLVQYEQEMQLKQRELTDPIMQGVINTVQRLAADNGIDMVLDRSAVPYYRSDLDLTDRAIQMYNGGGATKKPEPKAPAKPAPKKK